MTGKKTEASEIWRELYLSPDLEADIDKHFDEEKLAELFRLIGPKAKKWTAIKGIRATIRAYLWARFTLPERTPGEAEFTRMERFARSGERFSREITGLIRSSDADKRLMHERLETAYWGPTRGDKIYRQFSHQGGPGSVLIRIQELVDLLVESANKAASVASGESSDELRASYAAKASWFTRTRDRRILDKQCLEDAVLRFSTFWRLVSVHPVTPGKYYPEHGQFIGNAAQAAYLILHTIDHRITQRKIASAISAVNRRRKGNKMSGG